MCLGLLSLQIYYQALSLLCPNPLNADFLEPHTFGFITIDRFVPKIREGRFLTMIVGAPPFWSYFHG